MDTSNRKSVLKLIGGFAFAGLFCLCVHQCTGRNLKHETFPEHQTPVLVSDPNQLRWSEHIRQLKEEVKRNPPKESYEEAMNRLEAQERQARMADIYNNIYTVVDGAAYNATLDAIDYYMDNIDYYWDDPEDEIRFNPLIFDANRD